MENSITAMPRFLRKAFESVPLPVGLAFFATGVYLGTLPAVGASDATLQLPEVQLEQESAVKSRATKRWDALIERDFDAAYSYTSPAFRSRTSLERYKRQFGNNVEWTDANVVDIRCTDQRCLVDIELTYVVLPAGIHNTRTISERWIRIAQDWWIMPQ